MAQAFKPQGRRKLGPSHCLQLPRAQPAAKKGKKKRAKKMSIAKGYMEIIGTQKKYNRQQE